MRAAQVAEVIGGQRRGSGYLVLPDTVLTAWHVVDSGGPVRVRFDDLGPMEILQAHPVPNSDLALLKIDTVRDAEPAALGWLGGDHAGQLTVQFAGFPRWKYRQDRRFRELYHGHGSLSVHSNRRTGMLELVIPPPGADPEPSVSPWEGMSGAAVWWESHLIGVVVEHHRREGLGRLTAQPLDRLAGVLPVSALRPAPRTAGGDVQINVATGNAVQYNVQHGTIHHG